MLGSLILYLKGTRRMMFQLSGFYCRFLSSPFIIRVPFFLIVSFNKGPKNKKGERVLLKNLDKHCCGLAPKSSMPYYARCDIPFHTQA